MPRSCARRASAAACSTQARSGHAKSIAVDDALEELARFDLRQAQIVELRFFAGLSVQQTAEAVGLSRATVNREWAIARAWLRDRLAA